MLKMYFIRNMRQSTKNPRWPPVFKIAASPRQIQNKSIFPSESFSWGNNHQIWHTWCLECTFSETSLVSWKSKMAAIFEMTAIHNGCERCCKNKIGEKIWMYIFNWIFIIYSHLQTEILYTSGWSDSICTTTRISLASYFVNRLQYWPIGGMVCHRTSYFSFLPAPVSRALILHTYNVAWSYIQAVWKAVFHTLNEECACQWNYIIGPLLKANNVRFGIVNLACNAVLITSW